MELLAFGDPHIKPVESAMDFGKLEVPSDVDVIVTLGDVIHDAREKALDYGREFFERLAESGRPIITVPGNHDPVEHNKGLTADLQTVVSAHKRIISPNSLFETDEASFGDTSFVGWGCEEFDQGPEIRPTNYPSLSPNDVDDRRYAADQMAQRLEDAIYKHLESDGDEQAPVDKLQIETVNQGQFLDELAETKRVYQELGTLIKGAEPPVIVLSRVPP